MPPTIFLLPNWSCDRVPDSHTHTRTQMVDCIIWALGVWNRECVCVTEREREREKERERERERERAREKESETENLH